MINKMNQNLKGLIWMIIDKMIRIHLKIGLIKCNKNKILYKQMILLILLNIRWVLKIISKIFKKYF